MGLFLCSEKWLQAEKCEKNDMERREGKIDGNVVGRGGRGVGYVKCIKWSRVGCSFQMKMLYPYPEALS